jgi:hypothetical protein
MERFFFCYNIIDVWKSTWAIGLAVGIVSYFLMQFAVVAGGLAPILLIVGAFFLVCSCCLFLTGGLSFLFWKVPMAE